LFSIDSNGFALKRLFSEFISIASLSIFYSIICSDIACAKPIMNCDPLHVQSIYSRALEAFISKQFDLSADFYRSIISCRFDSAMSASIHLGLGRVYQEQGLKEQSINEYSQALSLNNKLTQAYANRGLVFASVGQFKRSIDDLNAAIKLDPKNYVVLTNRGVAHATIGKFSLSIRDFDDALKINPKYGEAYLNRGIIFELKGDMPSACFDWKNAVKFRQFSAKTWVDTQCQ
jgi:tetratricopeptide (TPR) repeat protein